MASYEGGWQAARGVREEDRGARARAVCGHGRRERVAPVHRRGIFSGRVHMAAILWSCVTRDGVVLAEAGQDERGGDLSG